MAVVPGGAKRRSAHQLDVSMEHQYADDRPWTTLDVGPTTGPSTNHSSKQARFRSIPPPRVYDR